MECKCKFKNVISNFDFNDCTLCDGYSPTTCQTPGSPRLKPFEFINVRVESRKQLDLNGIFNDICNGVGFVHDRNNNEKNDDIVFYHGELSPHTSATQCPTTVDFEGIDIVV